MGSRQSIPATTTTAVATGEPSQGWAELPTEILELIIEQLSRTDSINLRAVCTSWCHAAGRKANSLNRTPYLLTPDSNDNTREHTSKYCTLRSLPGRRHRRLGPLPQLVGKRFVGSQGGWLALVDNQCHSPILLNPLTKSRIPLPTTCSTSFHLRPSLNSSGRFQGDQYCEAERLCLRPLCSPQAPRRRRESSFIAKIVTSPNPTAETYEAVAILRYRSCFGGSVLYTRAGQDRWFKLCLAHNDSQVRDAIYLDGKFLILLLDGTVKALSSRCAGAPPLVEPIATAIERKYECRAVGSAEFEWCYLVESSGDLLQVRNRNCCWGDEERLVVRRLEPGTGEWVGVTEGSLRDRCLFLGSYSCSMSLSAGDIHGVKPCPINFADPNYQLWFTPSPSTKTI